MNFTCTKILLVRQLGGLTCDFNWLRAKKSSSTAMESFLFSMKITGHLNKSVMCLYILSSHGRNVQLFMICRVLCWKVATVQCIRLPFCIHWPYEGIWHHIHAPLFHFTFCGTVFMIWISARIIRTAGLLIIAILPRTRDGVSKSRIVHVYSTFYYCDRNLR